MLYISQFDQYSFDCSIFQHICTQQPRQDVLFAYSVLIFPLYTVLRQRIAIYTSAFHPAREIG